MDESSRSSMPARQWKTAGEYNASVRNSGVCGGRYSCKDTCIPALVTVIFPLRTAIAIRGKDGVVFAVEKLITSKLHERSVNRRICTIDRHIGIVSVHVLPTVRVCVHGECVMSVV